MESKFREEIFSTSDLSEMRDMFLAEKLVRSWKEDFVDEDTGQVISVERNELILPKGEKLLDTELSLINFHLQSNDIQSVKISNQQRFGSLINRTAAVWQVTAFYNNKKYNLFLYSDSLERTKEIASDYLEQLVQGLFSIVIIKELDYSTLIPEDFGLEENDEDNQIEPETEYYKIEVSIVDENFERRETFIVKATDAENAKDIIVKFLAFKQKERSEEAEDYNEIVTIISAKTIPCDYVIDYDFSLEYMKDED